MKTLTLTTLVILALAGPSVADDSRGRFQWKLDQGRRLKVVWKGSESGHDRPAVKAEVDMDWVADEAVVGTGQLRLVVYSFDYVLENSQYKVQVGMTAKKGFFQDLVLKRDFPLTVEERLSIDALVAELRSVVKEPHVVVLGEQGRFKICSKAKASRAWQQAPLRLFQALEAPPVLPREGAAISDVKPLLVSELPCFYAADFASRRPIALKMQGLKGGGLKASGRAKRSSKGKEGHFGFACDTRSKGFAETTERRCKNAVQLAYHYSTKGYLVKSSFDYEGACQSVTDFNLSTGEAGRREESQWFKRRSVLTARRR